MRQLTMMLDAGRGDTMGFYWATLCAMTRPRHTPIGFAYDGGARIRHRQSA